MTQTETRFEIFSDLYKDVHGFRPRGTLAQAFLTATPEAQAARLDSLQAELNRQLAQEQADREAFNAKVRALGLDPARFAYLA